MKKRVLTAMLSLAMIFSIIPPVALAGDAALPFVPDPNATEAVYEAELYEGIPFEPPISEQPISSGPISLEQLRPAYDVNAMISGAVLAQTNVYYGPSAQHALRETLPQVTNVLIAEKDGSFYLIQYSSGGQTVRGYVSSSSFRSGNLSSVPNAVNSINRLGLSLGSYTVYGYPSTASSIGSVGSRELVTVLKTDSGYYHIEYCTASGNKRGYLETSKVRIPTENYYKPIRTAERSNDYNGTSHKGIDIGAGPGTPVYSIAAGTAEYKARYKTFSGVRKMVSYGNYVVLKPTGTQLEVYYAHLSDFEYFTAYDYPNPDPVQGWDDLTTTEAIGSRSVSANSKLGETGNSGNSTGPHLHLEIRNNGTVVDPFNYVLFAVMPR